MNEVPQEFLRVLSSAVRAQALYPKAHPIREQMLDEILGYASQLLADHDSFDYFVHENSFFFGNRLLAKESLTMQWLMREWEKRGVASISVHLGVKRVDLEDLIDHLAEDAPPPDGGITVNTSKLFENELGAPLRVSKIRSAYADALDIIRDAGFETERGHGVGLPVGAAREAVDGLVTAVIDDPASALLLSTMRSHDEYTFFHMVNVCILSIATGTAIGLERSQLNDLGLGAILHDMGKVGVPTEVLNRSGPLDEGDWAAIRQHPVEGAAVILGSWDKISPLAARIAFEHHQHFDGTGYPEVRIGPHPHLLSRIVSVADTFDAITSRRAYRRAEQRQRGLDVLLSGAGEHYDPRIVRVFVRLMGFYPPGSVVQLDDDCIAVVIKNNPEQLDRPLLKKVIDAEGNQIEASVLDLSKQTDRAIVRGVDPQEVGIDPSAFVE